MSPYLSTAPATYRIGSLWVTLWVNVKRKQARQEGVGQVCPTPLKDTNGSLFGEQEPLYLNRNPPFFWRGLCSKQERKWLMPLVTIDYYFKGETVNETIVLDVDEPSKASVVKENLERQLEEITGIDPDQPDGNIEGLEVAYGEVRVSGWRLA